MIAARFIGALFLFVVVVAEAREDEDLVRKLNVASHAGEHSPALFQEYCGAELDALEGICGDVSEALIDRHGTGSVAGHEC